MAHNMESIDIFRTEIILPLIGEDQVLVVNDGFEVRLGSLRMRTFQQKGIDCVVCGCQGAYFSAERQKWMNKQKERPYRGGYHLNLYGVMPDGSIRLMTHDHIIPVSKYGANTLENSITMCEKCNSKKGNKLPSLEFIHKHGGAVDYNVKKEVSYAETTSPNF